MWYAPRLLLALVIAALSLTRGADVAAAGFALQVTLRDVNGQGIAGVTVLVRSEAGVEVRRAETAADGSVQFRDLPATVRVAVEGAPRAGPRLYQPGNDAAGVLLFLDQGDEAHELDLRVERDGMVLPDPATMIDLDPGGPAVLDAAPLPSAVVATPAPLPTASTAGSAPATAAVSGAPATEPSTPAWVPVLTLLIIIVALGVMLLIQRRRSSL